MPSKKSPYVSPGMPALKPGRKRSFFEFWPLWLMYLPVALQWLGLSLRYRSLTLPLLANPSLPLSGMVGVPKSTLMNQAGRKLQQVILDWMTYSKTDADENTQIDALMAQLKRQDFGFPLVCKPDIGCRGAGVKLVRSRDDLSDCLRRYPVGAALQLQRLSDYEPEAGIFYVRQPGEAQGRIISMAFKYMPYVVGDGIHSLRELIEQDDRAGDLIHLYRQRHQHHWDQVLPDQQPYRLIFSASHSKGAIFKDASHCITAELSATLDVLMKDLPDFNYGRLDVKFRDVASLMQGDTLQIIEINTASSESLHIWDSNTRLRDAVRSLLKQYRLLFRLGAQARNNGQQPPGIRVLLRHWRLERRLTQYYPETD